MRHCSPEAEGVELALAQCVPHLLLVLRRLRVSHRVRFGDDDDERDQLVQLLHPIEVDLLHPVRRNEVQAEVDELVVALLEGGARSAVRRRGQEIAVAPPLQVEPPVYLAEYLAERLLCADGEVAVARCVDQHDVDGLVRRGQRHALHFGPSHLRGLLRRRSRNAARLWPLHLAQLRLHLLLLVAHHARRLVLPSCPELHLASAPIANLHLQAAAELALLIIRAAQLREFAFDLLDLELLRLVLPPVACCPRCISRAHRLLLELAQVCDKASARLPLCLLLSYPSPVHRLPCGREGVEQVAAKRALSEPRLADEHDVKGMCRAWCIRLSLCMALARPVKELGRGREGSPSLEQPRCRVGGAAIPPVRHERSCECRQARLNLKRCEDAGVACMAIVRALLRACKRGSKHLRRMHWRRSRSHRRCLREWRHWRRPCCHRRCCCWRERRQRYML
mmetsp:Transcript_28472/g.66634  ORF Transcript_28472/g.66634 Transcript_28472/m.66634 type:complete len:451 (-) Transcript_28472:22-1374(-)